MQQINQYISEKLKIDKDVPGDDKPKTKKELIMIMQERIINYMMDTAKIGVKHFIVQESDGTGGHSVTVWSKEFDPRIPNRDINKVANDLYKEFKQYGVKKPHVLSTIIYFYLPE